MILSENRPVRKRTVGEIQTDIERNITYGEQQVEKYLQRLLGSLNVNSTVFTSKSILKTTFKVNGSLLNKNPWCQHVGIQE